jgi:hypothetical protein
VAGPRSAGGARLGVGRAALWPCVRYPSGCWSAQPVYGLQAGRIIDVLPVSSLGARWSPVLLM